MADVTEIFRECVNICRNNLRKEYAGNVADPKKHTIFSNHRQKTDFEVKARELTSDLMRLQEFLLSYRQDYINPSSHLSYLSSNMTDTERDAIDDESQGIIKRCQEAIALLKHLASKQKVHGQVQEHREAIYLLLENYLRGVCRLYSEQRAIRIKRAVDIKRLQRIEPDGRKVTTSSNMESDKRTTIINTNPVDEGEKNLDITPDEAALFEQENQVLFDEMNTMMNEVRQIEGKVVEISRLQEIFTEKILEQEKSIDVIAESAASTSDNIKDGNEEIREAMKNNAGFRVWILFVLVVLSVTLLFLDWYND